MRFHLLIQRHGLPATRVLWTTSPSSLGQDARSSLSLPSSLPNGGYTIAQFLEDVNEVVPLETETGLFENESGGQWGLEDYVVEVGGSECLHFMEVDGLLRDGDEVVVRALQLADLRARRVSGRHQISVDGRHLIDGVPFGRPFSKRSVSSRPGITIPPRKKRRTLLPAWGRGTPDDEEEDTEWEPTQDAGDQLALVPDNESSDEDGAVRHDIGNTEEGSEGTESDADESGLDGDDLAGELEGLNEDLGFEAPTPETAVHQTEGKHSLRRMPANQENVEPALPTPPEPHPTKEKSVRFDEEKIPARHKDASSDESDSSISESSCSDTSSDDDSDSVSSDSDSSDSDSSEGSDSDEDVYRARRRKTNPPGRGSASTRKSNRRNKMRRRLGRLKELGALHKDADFAALRTFDDTHKGPIITPALGAKSQAKEEEQAEFEAKRQKLLRDLESGGVDVDATSEKENVPPDHEVEEPAEGGVVDQPASEMTEEPVKKRLDVASFKRHLFGSLGVRTPRSKEDEEVTRKKLAGEPRQFQSQRETEGAFKEAEDEPEVDWQDKLILKATECVVDDIELTDPPFPFRQRWDFDAQNMIRQRKGLGKKRKRGRGRQLDGMADQAEYEDYGYANGEELNYDDNVFDGVEIDGNDEMVDYDDNAVDMEAGHDGDAADTDLPTLPDDLSSLADLVESKVKKGMIIAFKQLDMSKATNWQPRVSEYRVAETHSDPEDGMFSIRLAKRDRTPREDVGDEEGERQYSGFEMPGFEDEDDDGFREVAFSDLIEPKLLSVVDPGVGNEEASHPVEQAVQEPDEAAAVMEEPQDNPSQDQGLGAEESAVDDKGDERTASPAVRSPTFTRFETSSPYASRPSQDQPPQDQLSQGQGFGAEEPAVDNEDERTASPAIRSPTFTGFKTSSPDARSDEGDSDGPSLPVNQDANDDDVGLPPSNQSAAPHSPTPETNGRAPEIGGDIISSPKSFTSFDHILDDFIQGSRREASLDSEHGNGRPPESADESVPNPINIAKPEGHAPDELSGQQSPEHHSTKGRERPDKSVDESDWADTHEESDSQQIQSQMADIVDLTQDSPAGAPDVDDSEPLPRGPGWVQKDVPSSPRKTRASGRMQLMKEVSISPPSKGKK